MTMIFKFCLLILIALISIIFSLMQGSVDVAFSDLLNSLLFESASANQEIIQNIRVPRIFSAFIVGAMLSMAGALMQILLRNPLADPYILGISGGAAVAVLTGMLLGVSGFLLDVSAFFGALMITALVFAIGYRQGIENSERLLLTGVVVAAGCGAIISLLLSLAPDMTLRSMLFWMMGDLSHSPDAVVGWVVSGIVLLTLLTISRDLNVLMRGELAAAALGVSVRHVRLIIFICASLLAAFAVSIAGSIAFVGLIIPHLLRMVIGTDHRFLIPACFLFGGTFLLLADTFSRTLFLPQTIPVGALTATLGVPLFLFLLYRRTA